ncbi:MAG TPA: competence/damage-inducible protein A [Proteobacteria bacterium]|nr:putative competence-damage inducible protein [bacterium BMS3Abin14]HDL52627.1 competence/damage-inducible protein A [Pseudomonadota bacterium]
MISMVAVAVIGDEILLGEVVDRNLAWISGELFRLGVDLRYSCVLPDDLPFIVQHLRWMKEKFEWVITTGGIGATHDDLTRTAVAQVFKVPLIEHPEVIAALEEKLGAPLTPRLRQLAMLPSGVLLIPNPGSAAPGFLMGNVAALPGIPSMVRSMFPYISRKMTGEIIHSEEFFTTRFESQIADVLEEIQGDYPRVKIGSYPVTSGGEFRVRLVLRSRSSEMLKKAFEDVRRRVDS